MTTPFVRTIRLVASVALIAAIILVYFASDAAEHDYDCRNNTVAGDSGHCYSMGPRGVRCGFNRSGAGIQLLLPAAGRDIQHRRDASRKIENHTASVALGYFAHTFNKIHRTLRVTPAMAAGVTDRLLRAEGGKNRVNSGGGEDRTSRI